SQDHGDRARRLDPLSASSDARVVRPAGGDAAVLGRHRDGTGRRRGPARRSPPGGFHRRDARRRLGGAAPLRAHRLAGRQVARLIPGPDAAWTRGLRGPAVRPPGPPDRPAGRLAGVDLDRGAFGRALGNDPDGRGSGPDRRREAILVATQTVAALLTSTREAGASDLHLSAGMPPIIRQRGEIVRANLPPLSGEETLAMLYEIMTAEQRSFFETHHEIDF